MRRKTSDRPFFIPSLAPLAHPAPTSSSCLAPPALRARRAFSGRSLHQHSTVRARLPVRVAVERPSSGHGVSMFDESAGGDAGELGDNAEEGEGEDEGSVELRDDATGRTLSCGVEHVVEHGGTTYLLCYPMEEVVMFARAGREGEGEEELVALDAQAQIDAMFPVAEKMLADDDIVLKNTAFFLTMDDMSEEVEDDEKEEDEDGGEEEVEVMTDFEYQGESFLVVKPVFPVLLIAKEAEGSLVVLHGEELGRISDIVDEQMYKELAEESTAKN